MQRALGGMHHEAVSLPFQPERLGAEMQPGEPAGSPAEILLDLLAWHPAAPGDEQPVEAAGIDQEGQEGIGIGGSTGVTRSLRKCTCISALGTIRPACQR